MSLVPDEPRDVPSSLRTVFARDPLGRSDCTGTPRCGSFGPYRAKRRGAGPGRTGRDRSDTVKEGLAMPRRWGPGPVFVYESIAASRRWQHYAARSLFVLTL